MNSSVQTAFIVAAIAIGCAMQPLQGHDPMAGKLSGRNPLNAISEVLRSRERRVLDTRCFVRAMQAAVIANSDGCPAPIHRL